jgi:hypothetical protein
MAAPQRRLPPSRQYTLPLCWIESVRVVREDTPTPLPGYLCETCLDAPAISLVPAPWGGEMGVCRACQRRQAAARDEEARATRAAGDRERTPDE